MKRQNLIVIGLGPHARYAQYRFLEEIARMGQPVKVKLLVELQDRKDDIENYFVDKKLLPEEIFALPVSDRNSPEINQHLLKKLEEIKGEIDGLILCTEPKAHKKYILWALKNDIDVLADKPLTAPIINEQGPKQIWQDYLDIEQALKKSKARLSLMTNKRVHPAYQAVYQHVRNFVTEYNMPITHIDMSDGGGVWPFPIEFLTRENHPYKYGYGILLHTGFHYIDLLLLYQSINHLIGFEEDKINLHAFAATPFDVLHQMSQKVYEKLFLGEDFSQEFKDIPLQDYKQYGCLDVISDLQFEKDGAVITQASFNILQNTLSARSDRILSNSLYLKLGRLTQNYISIFCGPLFNVRLNYFQPDKLPSGEYDYYAVEVCRNTAVVGGESYCCYEFEDKTSSMVNKDISLNRKSKETLFLNWMNGSCPETDFALHKRTVWLTWKLFEEVFARRKERFGEKKN